MFESENLIDEIFFKQFTYKYLLQFIENSYTHMIEMYLFSNKKFYNLSTFHFNFCACVPYDIIAIRYESG